MATNTSPPTNSSRDTSLIVSSKVSSEALATATQPA
jgi:hypothetical protein